MKVIRLYPYQILIFVVEITAKQLGLRLAARIDCAYKERATTCYVDTISDTI
jgi:hypothetical protein